MICKKICYEWHEIKGKVLIYVTCKNFTIKEGKACCKIHKGKVEKVTAGEVFYLTKQRRKK